MPRAIWSGTLGFGLVQIPVALYGAEDKESFDMTMLDRRDFSPIGYERVNKKTGKEVPWSDVVKGYEHAKGKYVVLTDQDFQEANVEATRQIDILDFVDFSEIDPRYIDRPYYLAPQKNGQKAYALLREVLQRSGKAGIGKIVIRTRQHLAAVIAHEKLMLLVILRFSDELRKESDLDLPDTSLKKLGVTPKEVEMAERLVGGMVGKFDPDKYEDDYHRDLKKLIQRKVRAGEINTLPEHPKKKQARPAAPKTIDLAALLAESVQGAGKRSRGAHKTRSANENARVHGNGRAHTNGHGRGAPKKAAHTKKRAAETHHRKSA